MSIASFIRNLRTLQYPIPQNGVLSAHVAHRTGTLAALQSVGDSLEGEIAVATDSPHAVAYRGETPLGLPTPSYPVARVMWYTSTTLPGIEITTGGTRLVPLFTASGPFDTAQAVGDTWIMDTTNGHGFTLPSAWGVGNVVVRLMANALQVDQTDPAVLTFVPRFDTLGGTDLSPSGFPITNDTTNPLILSHAGGAGYQTVRGGFTFQWIIGAGLLASTRTLGLGCSTTVTATMRFSRPQLEVMFYPDL